MDKLQFKSEMVGDRSVVSLAHENRNWYINTANENGSTMRVRFSDDGMIALVKIYNEIINQEQSKGSN